MNYIALTGNDTHAMAQAAEILLEQIVAASVSAVILLYVNDAHQVAAIRAGLRAHEVGELWRVGFDPKHPELDQLVDVHLAQADGRCVSAALRGFVRQLSTTAVNPITSETETTV